MKNIAVQRGLNTVKDYLNKNGYTAKEIDTTDKNDTNTISSFDALILTGMDDNEMGFDTTSTKVPVINADGMTPEGIKGMLDRTFH